MVMDGAYNSACLEELAKKKGVDIQTTSLTGKAPEDIAAGFILNEDGTELQCCPAGNIPTSCKYNEKNKSTATMPQNCCASCPHNDQCKAKVNNKKNKSTVRIMGKTVSQARQARNFSAKEGRANACRRNGVEGVMSVMRRKYHLDEIPVFGLEQLKNWVWTSILSYNLVKYQKYKTALEKQAAAV